MKKVAAGYFKTHCLAIMDEVEARREAVVITKRGRPVAKLVPPELGPGVSGDPIFHFWRGRGRIAGDVVAPAIADWGDLRASD